MVRGNARIDKSARFTQEHVPRDARSPSAPCSCSSVGLLSSLLAHINSNDKSTSNNNHRHHANSSSSNNDCSHGDKSSDGKTNAMGSASP